MVIGGVLSIDEDQNKSVRIKAVLKNHALFPLRTGDICDMSFSFKKWNFPEIMSNHWTFFATYVHVDGHKRWQVQCTNHTTKLWKNLIVIIWNAIIVVNLKENWKEAFFL